jgi:thiamine pyrophosphokinase
MSSHALIVCNGEPPTGALLRRLARAHDMVIAADGGANTARAAGIHPHVVIGDLDSITPSTRRYCAGAKIIHVARQDNTDLEKALDFAAGLRLREVTIAGATGHRLDFTLGNLAIAWLYRGRMSIRFAGDGWTAVPVRRLLRDHAPAGTTVSLIPFGRCTGITLRGLHYPLRNGTLDGGAVAVSNTVVRSPFSVTVRTGRLLVVMLERTTGGRRSR